MICKHCNANLPDDTTVCPYCQAQVDAVPEQAEVSSEGTTPDESAGEYSQGAGVSNQNVAGNSQNTGSYGQNAGGYMPNMGSAMERPVNQTMYLVLSILMTVCCCLPAGIVGIVYASKISKAQAMGDIQQARQFAATTRIWLIVGLVVGLFLNLSMFVMLVWAGSAPQYY